MVYGLPCGARIFLWIMLIFVQNIRVISLGPVLRVKLFQRFLVRFPLQIFPALLANGNGMNIWGHGSSCSVTCPCQIESNSRSVVQPFLRLLFWTQGPWPLQTFASLCMLDRVNHRVAPLPMPSHVPDRGGFAMSCSVLLHHGFSHFTNHPPQTGTNMATCQARLANLKVSACLGRRLTCPYHIFSATAKHHLDEIVPSGTAHHTF